jgi:hypothetical protein
VLDALDRPPAPPKVGIGSLCALEAALARVVAGSVRFTWTSPVELRSKKESDLSNPGDGCL